MKWSNGLTTISRQISGTGSFFCRIGSVFFWFSTDCFALAWKKRSVRFTLTSCDSVDHGMVSSTIVLRLDLFLQSCVVIRFWTWTETIPNKGLRALIIQQFCPGWSGCLGCIEADLEVNTLLTFSALHFFYIRFYTIRTLLHRSRFRICRILHLTFLLITTLMGGMHTLASNTLFDYMGKSSGEPG